MAVTVIRHAAQNTPALAAFIRQLDPDWRCDPAMPLPDDDMIVRIVTILDVFTAIDENEVVGFAAVRSEDGVVKWLTVLPGRADIATDLLGAVSDVYGSVRGVVRSDDARTLLVDAGCDVDGTTVRFG